MTPSQITSLVAEHAAALTLYASQWTNAAEDCVQEAFLELLRQRTEPEAPIAWLYRVVRNRALNNSRGERRRTARQEALAEQMEGYLEATQETRLDAKAAALALFRIEDELREAVVLRIWSQRTFEEIAEIADCSLATAHRRYRRALDELHQILEPRESPCPPKKICPQT